MPIADAFAFGWGVNAGPPVYVPGTIPGLQLALESDLGLSGTNWTDQSSHGVTATISGTTMGTGTAINGKPTIRLNATTKKIVVPNASYLNFHNAGFDIFAVCITNQGLAAFDAFWTKAHSDVNNFGGWTGTSAQQHLVIFAANQGTQVYPTSTIPTVDNTPTVLEWGADGGGAGGNVRYGVGTTTQLIAQDNTVGAGNNTDDLWIGTDGTFFPNLWDLAAFYIYAPGILSSGNRATLISYLNGKYGSVG